MKTVILTELERRDRSVHYLHKKIGGNRTLLYSICKGYGRATRPQREKIANFFRMPVEELFSDDGTARREEN